MTKQERIQKNACILVHFYKKKVEIAKINEKTKIQGFSVLDWSQWISAFLVWVNCCC